MSSKVDLLWIGNNIVPQWSLGRTWVANEATPIVVHHAVQECLRGWMLRPCSFGMARSALQTHTLYARYLAYQEMCGTPD